MNETETEFYPSQVQKTGAFFSFRFTGEDSKLYAWYTLHKRLLLQPIFLKKEKKRRLLLPAAGSACTLAHSTARGRARVAKYLTTGSADVRGQSISNSRYLKKSIGEKTGEDCSNNGRSGRPVAAAGGISSRCVLVESGHARACVMVRARGRGRGPVRERASGPRTPVVPLRIRGAVAFAAAGKWRGAPPCAIHRMRRFRRGGSHARVRTFARADPETRRIGSRLCPAHRTAREVGAPRGGRARQTEQEAPASRARVASSSLRLPPHHYLPPISIHNKSTHLASAAARLYISTAPTHSSPLSPVC